MQQTMNDAAQVQDVTTKGENVSHSFFIFSRQYRYPASRGQMNPTSQSAIKMGVCGHFEAWVRKQEAVDVRETGVDVFPDIL